MKRLVCIVQLKFTYFLKNGDMLIHFYVGILLGLYNKKS